MVVADFCATLPRLSQREMIPFNRMEDWGAFGRTAPGAPVHSPFILRKQRLELK
jgi:NAD(P)H dehydrogenase (quinone)